MRFFSFLFFCCVASGFANIAPGEVHPVKFVGKAQGTTYQVLYYCDSMRVTQRQVDSIFKAIDQSLSIYDAGSLISQFNKSSSGVKMDRHLSVIVKRSLAVAKDTKGISDITVMPLVALWGMGPDRSDIEPDSMQVSKVLPAIGYHHLRMSHDTLFKDNGSVKIDVNGIAQGYTVDIIAGFLEANGINNFLVELGGEIRVKGRKYPGRLPMKIGIETLADEEDEQPFVSRTIQLSEGAITTSGGYRRFRMLSNGAKVSHLIDPVSGYPFNNELISVTVFAKDAITADAYDNALMGMGLKKALAFLSKHSFLQAYLTYQHADGRIADTATKLFPKIAGTD